MSGAILAFGGKGGSGKTTLAAMTIRQLIRNAVSPILAVDADPNANLALTLGTEPADTIADLRDRMGQAAQKVTEIPKQRLMDQWLAQLLSEQAGFDLLTMGRPEGPKCYCYVNALLRRYLEVLRGNYAAVVVDCEAGMEFLSRLTVGDVDVLVMVAEATPVGLLDAARIGRLADALPMKVRRRVLAINKLAQPGSAPELPEAARLPPADATVRVPFDEDLRRRCVGGEPIDADAGAASRVAIEKLARLCVHPATQNMPSN